MRLVIDEDVPEQVAELLRRRGHDVRPVRGTPLEGADDDVIAEAANVDAAIVVTWNHRHFSHLIARVPPLNVLQFPLAGQISFVCPRAMGEKRLRETLDDIEHEYVVVQSRRDRRLIMVIGDTWFRVDR
jgi:predicted nuclease of predicted toxin-antitoxin system